MNENQPKAPPTVCPECGSPNRKRPHTHKAPPVPEGFCLERGHRRHYARTGEVCSCPKYVRHPHCDRAEIDDTLPTANPWLTSAPQPEPLRFSDTAEEIEERLVYLDENACPHCGGSGHKDDVARDHAADAGKVVQGEHCSECGSDKLEWITGTHYPADVPDGRGRANEAQTIFALGCTECSETVRTIDTDAACEILNAHPAESREEIQAQALEEFTQLMRRKADDAVTSEASLAFTICEGIASRHIARLRTAGDDGEGV